MTLPALTASEQPTEVDLAYLAGFFDGEGAIGIYRNGTAGRSLYVQISQKALGPLPYIRDNWGGTISDRDNNHGGIYSLVMVGRKGQSFLRDILPYLQLRRAEAELAIEFQDTIPVHTPGLNKKLTEEDLAQREDYAERLAVLRAERRKRG